MNSPDSWNAPPSGSLGRSITRSRIGTQTCSSAATTSWSHEKPACVGCTSKVGPEHHCRFDSEQLSRRREPAETVEAAHGQAPRVFVAARGLGLDRGLTALWLPVGDGL
jgi:hypothetical protein